MNKQFFALVSIVCCAIAQNPEEKLENEITGAAFESHKIVENYKRLFAGRRREHLDAVRKIRALDSYESQYTMVSVVFNQMVGTIMKARAKVVGNMTDESLQKNTTILLSDPTMRDALSSVLENSALFGDIIFQLPEISQRILKKEKSWEEILKWSLIFIDDNRFLLDQPTIDMLDLVLQELNLKTRSPNYSNPFWPEKAPLKVKKQKKKHKGPQVARFDL